MTHQNKISEKQNFEKNRNVEISKKYMKPYLYRKNNLNDSGFLIKNHGGQKEIVHFSCAEEKKKELSTKNSMFSEISFRNEEKKSRHFHTMKN